MAEIGHNNGPALTAGPGWQRHCWTRARADLLPTLPLEVVRLRVRRAAELGLDYRTYASVRASTGRDVVGFLFSSNALRVIGRQRQMPPERLRKLAGLVAGRIGLANGPLTPQQLAQALGAQGITFDHTAAAPALLAGWPEARSALDAARAPLRWPSDAVLLVGEGRLERDWAAPGRLAGFIGAEAFFGA